MNNQTKDDLINKFFKIAKIPRKSGDEKNIIEFLCKFAKKNKLNYIIDDYNNLIIDKPSNNNNNSLILQGHSDMVYVKSEKSKHFYKNGIEPYIEDNYIYGKGTSLGADNGVSLVYMMKLMELDDKKLPNIRFIITSEEEIGLVGAKNLNPKYLNSDYLINLDTEEEGVGFIGCSGGIRSDIKINLEYTTNKNENLLPIEISIDGLKGGHSGLDIDKIRGNSIKVIGEILCKTNSQLKVSSINVTGNANSIANTGKIYGFIYKENFYKFKKEISQIYKSINKRISPKDCININIKKSSEKFQKIIDENSINKIVNTIKLLPQGIESMNPNIKNLVQTSSNIGQLYIENNILHLVSSSRSSIEEEMNLLIDKIDTICNLINVNVEFFNRYPAWELEKNNALIEIISKTYKKLFQKEFTLKSIHAGLECAYIKEKKPNMKIISIGPNIYDAHTIREKCDIESFYRTWNLLYEVLIKFNNF